MKIVLCILLVLCLVVLFDIHTSVVASKNAISLEKFTCKRMPNTIVSDLFCDIRYVSRDHLRLHLWGNLSKPVHDIWIHTVGYYKFNGMTYQRFAAQLWDNGCDWLAGKAKSYVLDWTIGRVLNYTNFNHPCPYEGHVYLKIDNISINHFPFEPLLPAGRFRIDLNLLEKYKKNVLAMTSTYLSISDHRIGRF